MPDLATQVVGDRETIAGSSSLYRSTGSLRATQRARSLSPSHLSLHVLVAADNWEGR